MSAPPRAASKSGVLTPTIAYTTAAGAGRIDIRPGLIAAMERDRRGRVGDRDLRAGRAVGRAAGVGVSITVLHGDMLAILPTLEANSFHAVCCDPPAGISFMGRAWDGDKGGRDQWIVWMQQCAAQCLRVVKPGGHALVWSLPRTSHWTATAWENAGWEVRDRLAHLFATGFPKSHNISVAIDKAAGAVRPVIGEWNMPGRGSRSEEQKYGFTNDTGTITAPATPEAAAWSGWGSALKPACEDWWLLRKPLSEKSLAANTLRHGVGGINIDASRIPGVKGVPSSPSRNGQWFAGNGETGNESGHDPNIGRFPANVLHDGSDEVMAAFAAFGESKSTPGKKQTPKRGSVALGDFAGTDAVVGHSDSGSPARFFYSAKASAADRAGSKHPTIKPIALIEWLVRLITPPGGKVLDPFAGSGTTGEACMKLGFDCTLIDLEADHVRDIQHRIKRWSGQDAPLFAEPAP